MSQENQQEKESITKSMLAADYGVSDKVFASWLKKCLFYKEFPSAKYSKILTPKQVNYIYSKLDSPD